MPPDWYPKLTGIDDPVVDELLRFRGTMDGKWSTTRIMVGRPKHHPPARAWYCPVMIQGRVPELTPVFGAGPVDTLLNAMGVIQKFCDDYFDISPGAKPKGSPLKLPRDKPAKQALKKQAPVKRPRSAPRKRVGSGPGS